MAVISISKGSYCRGAQVTARGGEVLVRLKGLPRVRGGTDGEFRRHYIDDLRRRLLKRTLGLPGMKALEIELAEA